MRSRRRSSGSRFSWLDAALVAVLAITAGLIWSRSAQPPGRREAVAVRPRVQPEAARLPPSLSPDREAPPDVRPPWKSLLPPAEPGILPPPPAVSVPIVPRVPDSALPPEDAASLRSLANLMSLIASHEASGAWPEAERVARRGLSDWPDESFLHLALSRALSQQGHDDEAADVLRRRLANRQDEMALRELARLQKQLQSVAGLQERSSSHFSIRFEGQADDALGKALLQLLEDKHSMLARTLDCEPGHEIPVILYPREAFRANSGAPSWAAGTYSHADGRIRIGTRDLSPGFVPLDLERTLTHELAHAFVHARTRGAVPGDINEGLAQYLSGARLGYRLDPSRAVAHGGQMKVDDYYDSALSFVEYLVDRYRQSTMNDLLKYAGETGSIDQAFRRAYHQDYEETRQEWLKQLR